MEHALRWVLCAILFQSIEGCDEVKGRDSEEQSQAFDPVRAQGRKRYAPRWIDAEGRVSQAPAEGRPSAESVSKGESLPDIDHMAFRDPHHFVAGGVNKQFDEWDSILPHTEEGNMVRGWVKYGVDVESFFVPFDGKFAGRTFKGGVPQPCKLPNAHNCREFLGFVSRTLEEWVVAGAIRLLGKVGEVEPPRVVMPLTVEQTKPRLCLDSRLVNLWVKDSPFRLEGLKEVPRLVSKGAFLTSVDHKSGYQNIGLTENSQTYFGIEWEGYYLVYTTLPFGFKASCYIYHLMSSMVASYGRDLGVPNVVYIDDSFNTELVKGAPNVGVQGVEGGYVAAARAVYIMCELWTRLGYTLSLHKSVLVPTRVLRFLGFLTDSVRGAFILPEDKKASFARLRESILVCKVVGVRTMQRLQGKCISFMLAVPGARIFISEMTSAIAKAARNSRQIQVSGSLREEIEHWRFVDEWVGCVEWRPEKHLQVVSLATDASLYKWGAVVGLDREKGDQVELADFWGAGDNRPIHLKEAEALLVTLRSMQQRIRGHRVDVYIDSMVVLRAWQKQGSRDVQLARLLKSIFELVAEHNVDLVLQYLPSKDNPADKPSRSISWAEAKLSEGSWKEVERTFGPHTVDLMATDANAMKQGGVSLRHFTPYPMPQSAGVNVFAQSLEREEVPYCYPPFCMLDAVLSYLEQSGAKCCTVVIPDMQPRPVWWPKINKWSVGRLLLGKKGEKHVLEIPTKQGFVLDAFGLRWDLWAVKLMF